jgi:hypothetical protein
MRTLVFAVAAGLLGACATSTPYQAASPASYGRYGFEEQRIENNRVRITFRGNSMTERETVETYLLYRAAEITLENGHDYFVVASRDTEEHSQLQGLDRPFPFDRWYYSPRWGWRPWSDPFWREPTHYREITRYEAVAEIATFDGQKPPDDPNAYDAREVMANLQGRIVRPPPAG